MSTPPTRWLARHLGRRGAALGILGLAFILIGVKSLLSPTEPADRFLLYAYLPSYVRGILWMLPGILALVAAGRRGIGKDGFGFAALAAPAIVMVVSYLWSTVAYLFGVGDSPYGWSSAVIWLTILAFIFTIAGWPEVQEPERPTGRGRRSDA